MTLPGFSLRTKQFWRDSFVKISRLQKRNISDRHTVFESPVSQNMHLAVANPRQLTQVVPGTHSLQERALTGTAECSRACGRSSVMFGDGRRLSSSWIYSHCSSPKSRSASVIQHCRSSGPTRINPAGTVGFTNFSGSVVSSPINHISSSPNHISSSANHVSSSANCISSSANSISSSAHHISSLATSPSSGRRFSSSEAASNLASPSVSVRTPHGAGTEGLSSQGLPRVDTDRAADKASKNPFATKDVLWGKKQQAFTPPAPPPSDEQIQALHDFIVDSEKLLVITGAGVSTESGIPDYRSPTGAYSTGFKPMTHQVRL
jgi:hypothetical protein